VENAGLEGAVVVNKVKEQKDGIGFDAIHETYVDMMETGIIDPVKVTKNALTNAVSISATLLTTEAAVGDIKEEKTEAAGNNMDMGY
jgi:chaperonin GroEL